MIQSYAVPLPSIYHKTYTITNAVRRRDVDFPRTIGKRSGFVVTEFG